MNSLFRIARPTEADVEAFHRDGYIFFPDVLQDAARQSLVDEILHSSEVRQYIDATRAAPDAAAQAYFVRPWDVRGPVGHRLIDDPFIESLLRATIGPDYHFCHSALNLAPRGTGPVPYHQDHHHWNHAHPINLAERDKYYIQILYSDYRAALGRVRAAAQRTGKPGGLPVMGPLDDPAHIRQQVEQCGPLLLVGGDESYLMEACRRVVADFAFLKD